MGNKKDNYLVDRFLLGEERAFDALVKEHQNQVVNIVYSLLGQAQEAEDIAQEVFIKVYKNLGSFNKKAKFSTWLYRITVNTTFSYLKKEKGYAYTEEANIPEKTAPEEIERREEQNLIRKAIGRLPFKYRTVIILKEIEDLSYKDIAKTLGCRMGTVESRLFRARGMLKKILSPLIT